MITLIKFNMVPIVLDANFLLLPFQRRVDIEKEVEQLIEEPHFFVVLQQVVDELSEMYRAKRKFSLASRGALSLVDKFKVEKNFPGKPDAAMLRYCLERGAVLATLDVGLRREARKKGARVILLRGGGHLAIT